MMIFAAGSAVSNTPFRASISERCAFAKMTSGAQPRHSTHCVCKEASTGKALPASFSGRARVAGPKPTASSACFLAGLLVVTCAKPPPITRANPRNRRHRRALVADKAPSSRTTGTRRSLSVAIHPGHSSLSTKTSAAGFMRVAKAETTNGASSGAASTVKCGGNSRRATASPWRLCTVTITSRPQSMRIKGLSARNSPTDAA